MENQEQIINQLKAEVYDISKQLQQTSALLGQIAKLVEAESVDEMLSKITKAFAGTAEAKVAPKQSGRRGGKTVVTADLE